MAPSYERNTTVYISPYNRCVLGSLFKDVTNLDPPHEGVRFTSSHGGVRFTVKTKIENKEIFGKSYTVGYYPIVAFGKVAVSALLLKKGAKIIVEGRLSRSSLGEIHLVATKISSYLK